MDAGITYQIISQKGWQPNVSVSPGINFVTNFKSSDLTKLWPIIDVNAFWHYSNRRNYVYVGINNYFELNNTGALGLEQDKHWLFSPQIGHVHKSKNGHWQVFTELKFLAPYINNSKAFIPYKSILGEAGATGFYLGIRKSI